jgi:tRNA uridine 5-carbamoylmethylation protein Kti12
MNIDTNAIVKVESGVLLVCGVPGIGKSTLSSKLHEYINLQRNVWSFLLSYDEIINTSLENELIKTNGWKFSRYFLMKLVRVLICLLNNYPNLSSLEKCIDQEIKLFSDHDFVSNLNDSILDLIKTKFNQIVQVELAKFLETKNRGESVRFIVILDDVFYYESMRYCFYKQSIDLQCSYISLCLKADDLNILLERNKYRDINKQLSESIIVNIFQKFDYPNDLEWEKNFTHIFLTENINLNDSSYLANIFERIDLTFKKFNSFLVDLNEKFKLNEENLRLSKHSIENLIHKSDLILRKLISDKLKENLNRNEKIELASKLNQRKAIILNEFKSLDKKNELNFLFDNQFIENELKFKLYESFF